MKIGNIIGRVLILTAIPLAVVFSILMSNFGIGQPALIILPALQVIAQVITGIMLVLDS